MSKDCRKRNSTPDRGKEEQMGGGNTKRLDLSEKENDLWPELRCPICLDHPHNSVLLICSSHSNGCRPFMCDTSELLSNCFREFCKLHSVVPSESGGSNPNKFVGSGEPGQKLEFGCPHCRGEITGWVVVESARGFMNGLARNCSVDWCEFSGNFCDLRNHAESEHPTTRPRDQVGDVIVVEGGEFDGFVGEIGWEGAEFDGADILLEYIDFDGDLQDFDFGGDEGIGVESLLDLIQFD